MIALFTDYGLTGPYLGQVEAVMRRIAPDACIVKLLADAPRNDPRRSAYLLAATGAQFPAGTVFFCVVDPGVGTGADLPVVVRAEGCSYVGPDNGLFDIVLRRARSAGVARITWEPERLSDTFHGRDLYAPVCAMLESGQAPSTAPCSPGERRGWPDDLAEIIYLDHFGNAMTGLRGAGIDPGAVLHLGGVRLRHAGTFGRVPEGAPFWYVNSIGLVEIAVNRGSAAERLGMRIGDPVNMAA